MALGPLSAFLPHAKITVDFLGDRTVCQRVSSFLSLNKFMDFSEVLYQHCAIGGMPKLLFLISCNAMVHMQTCGV